VKHIEREDIKAHFISKLSDSDSENSETQVWLLFAKECNYINSDTFDQLYNQSREVGKLLSYMMDHSEKFIIANKE